MIGDHHLLPGVRDRVRKDQPRLGISPSPDLEGLDEGEEVLAAGWVAARQHPRGMEGTVFVTIEDETGDVQLIVWPRVFARYKRELGNSVLLAKGVVSRHDGTTNVTMSSVRTLDVGARMPDAHDWH